MLRDERSLSGLNSDNGRMVDVPHRLGGVDDDLEHEGEGGDGFGGIGPGERQDECGFEGSTSSIACGGSHTLVLTSRRSVRIVRNVSVYGGNSVYITKGVGEHLLFPSGTLFCQKVFCTGPNNFYPFVPSTFSRRIVQNLCVTTRLSRRVMNSPYITWGFAFALPSL